MHRLKLFALLVVCLLVVGLIIYSAFDWSLQAPSVGSTITSPSASSVMSSSSASATGSAAVAALGVSRTSPVYQDYSARVPANGGPMVLFFALSSDPFSMKHDALLGSLSASGKLKLPVYRVDFGLATGALVTYAVFVPDTFVVLDASGQRTTSLIHPSSDELLPFIASPH